MAKYPTYGYLKAMIGWSTASDSPGFANNFFGCAGYKVLDNNGFNTVEDGVEAAMEAHADVVVLCASDEDYATLGPLFGRLMSGKGIPVIAGYPKEILENLRSAGITQFIHVRSNLLQTLQSFNKLIFKS